MEQVESLTVEAAEAGMRLDAFLARRGLGLTRSRAEKLAKGGQVLVEGRRVGPGRRLASGERVEVRLPPPGGPPVAEAAPLNITFEDEHVLVVNKPQGMVVHPGAGRATGTLVNFLLAHTPLLAMGRGSDRPGIVHRLDRDTSGLMVVAKSEAAYRGLSRQVKERELERRYLALVWGRVAEDRLIIDIPIGRQLRDRKRMAAVAQPEAGRRVRAAATDARVAERLGRMTVMEVRLPTGRTHQIRVHLAHVGHPVVGDRIYGLRKARKEEAMLDAETLALVAALPGQALHAQSVSFRHPITGQAMRFSVPAPREMASLLMHLRRRAAG